MTWRGDSSRLLPWTSPLIAAALCFSCGSQAPGEKPVPPSPATAAAPRLNDWRILGPGGGSAQFNPLPSPHDKNTILVSTDMTGCYVTEDGGASWRMFYFRWTCRFAFDPKNPNVFYAAAHTAGLYRTEDRGRTWRMIFPEAKEVDQLYYHEDEAEQFLYGKTEGRRQPLPAVTVVATHPEDPNILYTAAGIYLWRSTNGGKSWSFVTKAFPEGRRLWIDPRPGVRKRKIFFQSINRFGMLDGGFEEMTPPNKITRIRDSAVVYPPVGDTPTIYMAVDGTFEGARRIGILLSSTDLGKTWQECWRPLASLGLLDGPMPLIRAIGTTPANPNVLYLSYSNLSREAGRPASFGVARSDDAGRTFRLVWEESDKPSPTIRDPWLSEIFGPDWGENPLMMSVHPSDPDYVVATDLGRTLKTMDGGKTWQGLYSKRVSPTAWTSTGLDVLNCYGVHFDPFKSGRLLASCTDIGVFRSEDRGATWSNSWTGVPRAWRNTMYWAEFDPAVPGLVWGAASRYHDIPRARVFRNRNQENWQGGIVVSRDSGATWTSSSEGLPNAPFTHILLDPKSPKERRTLYAAGVFYGVYRSDDGGRTWAHKSAGIASETPNAWRLHLDTTGSLYLTVIRRTPRSEAGTPSIGALYRSDDRAESWQPVALPEGVNGPTDLISDPLDPNRLLLTAWPKFEEAALPARISGGGLYLSTDRGKTWRAVLPYPQHMYSVSADPGHPGRFFATGFGSAAFRSDDRGETWTRIRGFNFKLGHRIFPDPFDPARIYITTMGGSLWYGPAAGTPESDLEDILGPPPVRFDAPPPKPGAR